MDRALYLLSEVKAHRKHCHLAVISESRSSHVSTDGASDFIKPDVLMLVRLAPLVVNHVVLQACFHQAL